MLDASASFSCRCTTSKVTDCLRVRRFPEPVSGAYVGSLRKDRSGYSTVRLIVERWFVVGFLVQQYLGLTFVFSSYDVMLI